MKQRILAALLALCLLTAPALAAENSTENFLRTREYTGQFSDLTEDTVFYDNVTALYEYGLSVGKLDGTFGLKDSVTVSQILIFAGRIRSLYRTGDPEAGPAAYKVPGTPTHEAYLKYLQAEGVVGDELEGTYLSAATRSQVAHVLARTLPAEELPLINDGFVTESYATRVFLPDVTEYTPYQTDILFLYRCGIAVGSDEKGTFYPEAPITRGAAAAMLTRMVDPTLRLRLDWPPLLLAGTDVTLGGLVPPGAAVESPRTPAEMDACIRRMLSSGANTLELSYPGITIAEARARMQEALSALKVYCEQGYNVASCAVLPDGKLQLSFSTAGAGGRTEEYRAAALEAAIAVHDELWASRKITHSMTEREKARVYYDWICANTVYDETAGDDSLSHSPYGLFARGLAVCDGYTGAYNLLLKLEGISCYALYTDAHIWTVAWLDGEEVHIDATWGDVGAASDEEFFAMSSGDSWAHHPW